MVQTSSVFLEFLQFQSLGSPGFRSGSIMLLNQGILTSILRMKEKEELCDTVILIEDERFPAHKLMLAASSAFFHAMFTSNFEEKNKDEVRLEQQSADCFAKYLSYVYNGEVELTPANVEGIYGLATFLQAEELMRFCEKFMSVEITEENCISYLLTSNQKRDADFYDKAVELVAKNFSRLSGKQSFYNLGSSTLVDVLKQGDNFDDSLEESILEKVMAWLENNDASASTAADLFQHVRWGLFGIEMLKSLLKENPFISQSEDCKEMLNKAIEYLDDEDMQPLNGGTFSTPRGLPTLVAVGGVTGMITVHSAVGLPVDVDMSEEVLLHETFSKKRPSIAELPVPMHYRDCYSSVVVNNILFVVGGCLGCFDDRPPFSQNHTSQYLFKYIPLLNRWRVMCAMVSPRAGHSAVAVEYPDGVTRIMVIGGCHISFGDISPTEVYDIEKDSWNEQDVFPHNVYAPAACVLKGSVYVSGGEDENVKQKYMYRLTPRKRKWERLSDMTQKLSGHGMFSLNDLIYIFPLCPEESAICLEFGKFQCYDPEVNQHSKLTNDSFWRLLTGITEGQLISWKGLFYRGNEHCEKYATHKIERETTFREIIGQGFRFHYCSEFCDGQCDFGHQNYRLCTARSATLAVLYLPHNSA